MRLVKEFKNNRVGETIPEALVTFLIATFSIIIIVTSIITTQKIITKSEDEVQVINLENQQANEFIASGDNEIDGVSLKTYKDKISISSDGYLYSEDEISYIKTEKLGIKAFR